MSKIRWITGLLLACMLLASLSVAFALGESRVGRIQGEGNVSLPLPGRLSRGSILPSLGSPGSVSTFDRPVDVTSNAQAPSNTQAGVNTPSGIPINLGLSLNLFGISIDGQEILQGNTLTSTQLVLLSQSAAADLVALNIATIVQNTFQIGINVNFSPMITVVFADNSWTVVTEPPSALSEGESEGST